MTSEILDGKLLWYFTISFVYSLPYFLYSNFFFDMNDTDCILSYFREYSIFNIHPEHWLWKKNIILLFSNLHLCKLLSLTWHIHTLLIFYANLSSFPFISHFGFILHTFYKIEGLLLKRFWNEYRTCFSQHTTTKCLRSIFQFNIYVPKKSNKYDT